MPMTRSARPFTSLRSPLVALPGDNIDTDQLVPARFLTTTSRGDLRRALLHDWRFDATGEPIGGCPIDDPRHRHARILVTGHNFGCGSSREHAAWALCDHGFRAVIATGFAEIFRHNALRNGLLPLVLPTEVVATLAELAETDPSAEIEVDLEHCRVTLPDAHDVTFNLDPFARRCLLEGVDALGYLLGRLPEIEAFDARRPRPIDTTRPHHTTEPVSKATP